MTAKIVMDRLVANRGKYVDEMGRDQRVAQFFAVHRCSLGEKLVLLMNSPDCKMRELTLTPDGQVVLRPTIIDTLIVRRGQMCSAVHVYNESGRGKLSDVFAL
jgi:hypothetical protein